MSDKKRILIMEDSDIFADMLINFLESNDCVIERAVNGFEGIKKVYNFLPHLIITDIEMPVLKGYQVTRLLKSRKNTKTIPVIVLTTLNNTKDRFWGEQAGADMYLEKSPENFGLLKDAITDLFSNSNNIEFSAIELESKKINDNSIIEIVSNLLDNKLFQTTITGLLAELSLKIHSMDLVIEGIFNLLKTVCESELASIYIRGNNNTIYKYNANFAGFAKEIIDNYNNIVISDFKGFFPEFKYTNQKNIDFFPAGENNKKLLSYITLPLSASGEVFAHIFIANTINDYFTPSICDNLNIFLNSASPIISSSLSMYEINELQKNTRAAFARYVPADKMDEIINESTKKAQMSESRNVAVLFSDIRDFTKISEIWDAQVVVDFLNTYFSKMGYEIISESGHIDKFIGDAIMAVFGAFGNIENPAENSICAAVRMLALLEEMNESGIYFSNKKIYAGIGINYGVCILGNIGFKNKMDYTIIGDTVNLASRIEPLTKLYRHPLLVSESVYELTKELFLFRKVGNVKVIGKEKPVEIYAVYSGYKEEGINKLPSGASLDLPYVSNLAVNFEALTNYNKGLSTFYMREWRLAHEYFTKSLQADKDDYLSSLYLERCNKFIDDPPPDDWNGVLFAAR